MLIPEHIRNKLASFEIPADQRATGIATAVDLVHKLSAAADGFYFICPRNKADAVLPLIQAAQEREKRALSAVLETICCRCH